jgi:hypothetical protein
MNMDPDVSNRAPSNYYRSRFDKWDKQSWVRSKPHRIEPFASNLDYYPESLAVLFTHDQVKRVSPSVRRHLLVLHLYNYLEFTVWLELGPVNEVCDMLRRDTFLPWLPPQMKDDALKIYVDEGGHAEMSHALKVAVAKETRVASLNIRPAFLDILDALAAKEHSPYYPLIQLFFVVVSETLITGTLVKLPKDETIQLAVRTLASDHATDEGRHHAYFRELFEYLWPRLPCELRAKIGAWLPDMLLAFLQPDSNALVKMLGEFPADFPIPRQVVDEVVNSRATLDSMREAASPTLRMLWDNGVFEDAHIAEAFQQRGLPYVK